MIYIFTTFGFSIIKKYIIKDKISLDDLSVIREVYIVYFLKNILLNYFLPLTTIFYLFIFNMIKE